MLGFEILQEPFGVLEEHRDLQEPFGVLGEHRDLQEPLKVF